MVTSAFDITIRALECQKCAAPINAPSAGGQVTCHYCGAVNHIGVRRSDAPGQAQSMADEVARLSQLKSQLEHPVHGHPYDMSRPSGGMRGDEPDAVIKKAWQAAKATGAGASPDSQRRLCWLALRLASSEARRDEITARAVLETALDLLPDVGHRMQGDDGYRRTTLHDRRANARFP